MRAVRILRGPSRPYPALAEGALTWRRISHLGLNYLSLTDVDANQGAAALREMLDLYGNLAHPAVRRQIQARALDGAGARVSPAARAGGRSSSAAAWRWR